MSFQVFPENVLQHFRCGKCFSVLSTGPIYSSPDGFPVCGRCPPSPTDVKNPPLEAFLAMHSFPCKYRENGCKEYVSFNQVGHEERCQFKEIPTEPPFELIDNAVLPKWKCHDCENLLTVGPLSLTPEGESICGRCVGRWSEVHVEEPLIRNWKMEYIMKQLPLPCMHHDLGCKRALKWGEVEKHEDFCPHRPHTCPATPDDSCDSIVPARQLFTHFEKEHSAFLLTSPKFTEKLGKDSDMNRLVRIENRTFLLMSRVRVSENRMWFSAALIGDVNMASKIRYVLKITNAEETREILCHPGSMQSDFILRINEESAISNTLEKFRTSFGQPNLQEIICNVTIEECAETEPNWDNLKQCKFKECRAFGSESSVIKHEAKCNFGTKV